MDNSIKGFRTTVTLANSTSAGDGIIANSLRFTGAGNNLAFIEIGYENLQPPTQIYLPCPGGGLNYFITKLDSIGFSSECLAQVPTTDIGQDIVLEISSLGPDLTMATSIKASISTPSMNVNACGTSNCTNSFWSPGATQFGFVALAQTLQGSKGASASTAAFSHNSYELKDGIFAFESAQEFVAHANPPFMDVLQSATVANSNGGVYLSECCLPPQTVYPALMDFGTVTVGQSLTQTIIIANRQTSGNLSIGTISLTGTNAGDFTQTSNCAGTVLNPSTTCNVTLTFKPTLTGVRTATLAVTYTAINGTVTDTSDLSGTGH